MFASDADGSCHSEEVTGAPLVMLPCDATREQVTEALSRCLPGDTVPMVNGFPVVDRGGRLCGLVTRDTLEKLLQEPRVSAGRPSRESMAANVLLSEGQQQGGSGNGYLNGSERACRT